MHTFHEHKKIELHCHLDGSLPLSVLEEIADENGIAIPKGKDLAAQVQVHSDNDSLEKYLTSFDIPLMLLHHKGSIRKAVLAVLEDVAKENVIYTELRFAPLPLEGPDYQTRDMIEEAIEGLKEGRRYHGVEGNIILCGMRHVPAQENMRFLSLAREYLGYGVCGVDTAGAEALFPVGTQADFFKEAKRLELPYTIHAGECGSAQSVKDALELGASRIGHGISVYKDPELMKLCKNRRIPLEMCPISNMQTKAEASPEAYPFPLYMREGLSININTDNRTVSNTCLDKEYDFLAAHYGLTAEDVQKLNLNALEAAFADEDTKHRLWKQLTGRSMCRLGVY